MSTPPRNDQPALDPHIEKASLDIIRKNAIVLKNPPYETVSKIKSDIRGKAIEAEEKSKGSKDENTKLIYDQIAAMYQIAGRALDYLTQYIAAPKVREELGAEIRYTPKRVLEPTTPTPAAPTPGAPSQAPTPMGNRESEEEPKQ